jgi:ACS family glucarate transporter-like MFS transporter
VLLLILSYGLQGYTTYVFYTWFYLYVVNVRKLPAVEAGFWSSVPFFAFGAMSLAGGFCSDLAVRRLGRKAGRRACAFIGLFGAALVLVLGSRIHNPYVAVCVLSLGAGFNAFSTVSFWAVTIDITPEYAGSLSGLMNMAGNISGAISPTLTPYLAERYGWTAAIDAAALAIGSAGLVWLFIDANRRLPLSRIPIDSRISAAPK